MLESVAGSRTPSTAFHHGTSLLQGLALSPPTLPARESLIPRAAGDTRHMLVPAADWDVPTAPFAATERWELVEEDEGPVFSTESNGQAVSG